MRRFVYLTILALAACGEETVQRSVVGRSSCQTDVACPSGQLCIDGFCEAPIAPLNAPEPANDSANAILEAVGPSPFDAENAGQFAMTFSVPGSHGVNFKDGVQRAKLRTRFLDGGVRVWGLELDSLGGPLTVPTQDGDRIYYVTNVKVRSSNEFFVALEAADSPVAKAQGRLDMEISADVGATDTATVRLTARLEQVLCSFEFAPSSLDNRLHAKVTVAEQRDLYGPPGSGLSIEGLSTELDLAGATIPERWIKR